MFNINTTFLTSLWSLKAWQSGLKSAPWLLFRLNKLAIAVIGTTNHSIAGGCWRFVQHVNWAVKTQGLRGTQIRLKAMAVALQRAAAGLPKERGGVALALTRTGFPRVIPPNHRRLIRSGDRSILRLWLTFFMLYRVIDVKARVSYKSIVAPFSGWQNVYGLWLAFMPVFTDLLWRRSRFLRELAPRGAPVPRSSMRAKILPLLKSGPNSIEGSPSIANALYDAFVLTDPVYSGISDSIANLAQATDSDFVQSARMELQGAEDVEKERFLVGRVALKDEPGKVRVFAMIDFWSQTVLSGLHQFLYKVLGSLNRGDVRIDGTFDQGAAFSYAASRSAGKKCYSFDLSSATDRFPLWAQESVIRSVCGAEVASPWAQLFRTRPFSAPLIQRCRTDLFSAAWRIRKDGTRDPAYAASPTTLFYKVGQPMGAMSSWAAFSLAHHCVVQFAAYRCGYREWFEDYVLLGDDVVIWDDDVATQYLSLTSMLGGSISLYKSLPGAKGALEFAKRFAVGGDDCSPLSVKEFAIASQSLSALIEFVNRAAPLAQLRFSSVLRFLGFGYRATGALSQKVQQLPGKRLRRTVIALSHPMCILGAKHWDAWFGLLQPGVHRTVPAKALSRVHTSLLNWYMTELTRSIMRISRSPWFENIRWTTELPIVGAMYSFERLKMQLIEAPIVRDIDARIKEVESWISDPTGDTLDDVFRQYRDYLAEMQALAPVIDLYKRPKAHDPQLIFSEIKLWEGVQAVIETVTGRRASRKAMVARGDWRRRGRPQGKVSRRRKTGESPDRKPNQMC